jgi:MFS family permease
VAAILALFYAAAGAPSPLYGDYAARWHFADDVLTVVFAVYALPLLVALLAFGAVSDAIGRKPVVLGASALLAVSLGLFVVADGLGVLIAARALQGFATGLLTTVASAALLDLQPARRPGLASLLGASLSTAGLAVGALVSGALVQYAWSPSKLTYLIILALLLVLAVAVAARVDETVRTRQKPRIRIRVAVPPEARPAFIGAIPCLVSTWALNSFYLSLGPKLAASLSHTRNHLPGAVAVALLCALACLGSLAARNRSAKESMVGGCAVLATGSGLTVAAVASSSAPSFYLSTAIAGIGFGVAFSGTFRSLVALARPDQRGALIAATYVVGYTAFAVPAIVAGIVSTREGLTRTATGYSAVVAVLALIALVSTGYTSRPEEPSIALVETPPGQVSGAR